MIFKGNHYTFIVEEENLRMLLLLVIPSKGNGALSEFLIENTITSTISYPDSCSNSDRFNFEITLRILVRNMLAQLQTEGHVIKLLSFPVLSYESNPLYSLKAMHIFSGAWLEHTKVLCANYMVQIYHKKRRRPFYKKYIPSQEKVWIVKKT